MSGVITDIKLSDDFRHIIATAQMVKDADRMLREDSLLWVVKPRIGKEGISGLDTLLSGAYIQLQPGQSKTFQDEFSVLDLPPIAPPDAKGLRLILTNKEAGKLSVGDPVMYEGFTVGRVESTLGGFGPESTVYRELETTLRELNQVMAEFKPVLRTINEKPNALIFGESNTADPIPAKGKQE